MLGGDGQQLRFSPSQAEQHSRGRAEMYHSCSEESDLVSLSTRGVCCSGFHTFLTLSASVPPSEQRGMAQTAGEFRLLVQDFEGRNHTLPIFLPRCFV